MTEEKNFIRQRVAPGRLPHTVVAKWSTRVLNEGFVPFPKRLLRCLPKVFVGPNAIEELTVVLAIVDYKRPNLSRLPSLNFLAFVAGMQPKEFRARLSELEKRSLIIVSGDDEEMDIELTGLLEQIEQHTATRDFDSPF